MTKEKRKFYRISEMRQAGLNYIQRGIEIQKIKMSGVKLMPDSVPLHSGIAHQPSMIHPGGMTRWQRFWDFIKRILHI